MLHVRLTIKKSKTTAAAIWKNDNFAESVLMDMSCTSVHTKPRGTGSNCINGGGDMGWMTLRKARNAASNKTLCDGQRMGLVILCIHVYTKLTLDDKAKNQSKECPECLLWDFKMREMREEGICLKRGVNYQGLTTHVKTFSYRKQARVGMEPN